MDLHHLPWLEMSILVPFVGGIAVSRLRDRDSSRHWFFGISAATLACVIATWLSFERSGEPTLHGQVFAGFLGENFFAVDQLNASLLGLTALIYLLTGVATPRVKNRRFSFGWTLVAEGITLATLACKEPWGIIALLAAGTVPPYLELRARHRPSRVYLWHMGIFVCLLVVGWAIVETEGRTEEHSWLALVPLLAAIFIRAGLVPAHCWMTDLFEHAAFGTALLFVTPMPGAYAAVRLVLPIAPEWVLRAIGMVSLVTAIYAAGMALVQREARRFFCYLFLSHSALVMVGMDTIAPIGLTGGLCVWLSVGLALAGLGLTLRALEARHGRLSLANFHGLGEYTPALATCFLLTGLASVGFPGTFGFLGTEMLVDGAVQIYPYIGVAVVVVAALNGIAIVQTYFLLFTGTKHVTSVPLGIGWREKFVVATIAVLLVLGGLFPQSEVASRHQAALAILAERNAGKPPLPLQPAMFPEDDDDDDNAVAQR